MPEKFDNEEMSIDEIMKELEEMGFFDEEYEEDENEKVDRLFHACMRFRNAFEGEPLDTFISSVSFVINEVAEAVDINLMALLALIRLKCERMLPKLNNMKGGDE